MATAAPVATTCYPVEINGESSRAPRRLGGDRGHHQLHQHLEPLGDDRRGPAGPEGRRRGPRVAALGQDQPRPRLPGRHRLPRPRRPAPRLDAARLPDGRVRLHHLHRQQRPAPRSRSPKPSTSTNSSSPPCSRGNRNFEARVHPQVRANYLVSPVLVVAFALAGRVDIDLNTEPLGIGRRRPGRSISRLWPSPTEIAETMAAALTPECSGGIRAVFEGDERMAGARGPGGGARFAWDPDPPTSRSRPSSRTWP